MKDHLLRGLLLAGGLVLTASIPARAQDYPKFQTSLGLSYLHLEGSGNLLGMNGSFAGNPNGWLGFVFDFGGYHGWDFKKNVYSFQFGPRFSYRKDKRLTPFAHILPGFALGPRTVFSPPFNFAGSPTGGEFAMAVGGGVDLNPSSSSGRVALRVQADYLLTYFGTRQNNVRVTTGLVFRIW